MTVITQRDNQAIGRFGGLYWGPDGWTTLANATAYDDEDDALAALDNLIDRDLIEVDDCKIVEWPQIP